MKLNRLVDDNAGKYEVAQPVNFAVLACQAILQAQFITDTKSIHKLFDKGKVLTLCCFGRLGLINGNHLKEFLLGMLGYTWCVLENHNMISVQILKFLF